MDQIESVRIKCRHCAHVFLSPIFIGNVQTFETAALLNNLAQCPKCGQMNHCNKENMAYRLKGGGGWVGPDFGGSQGT